MRMGLSRIRRTCALLRQHQQFYVVTVS